MLKYLLSFLIFNCAVHLNAQDNKIWMIGPMVHINLGGEKTRVSYALELSYWDYNHWPYSFDGGIEFEKQKFRLYTEAQTGIGLAGVAFGPLLEYNTSKKVLKPGIQGSFWGNYFLGFDFRIRYVDNTTFYAPGTYFKIPIGYGGGSDSHHHHHHFHWDD